MEKRRKGGREELEREKFGANFGNSRRFCGGTLIQTNGRESNRYEREKERKFMKRKILINK